MAEQSYILPGIPVLVSLPTNRGSSALSQGQPTLFATSTLEVCPKRRQPQGILIRSFAYFDTHGVRISVGSGATLLQLWLPARMGHGEGAQTPVCSIGTE